MNGIGRPVIGITPTVIATFWNTCHSSIVNTPAQMYVPSRSRDRWAMRQMRSSTTTNRPMTTAQPTSPNCSPIAENGKSAHCTGMSFLAFVIGPCSQPLPVMPPVATARMALRPW